MINVLFVCSSNVCRSPYCEYMFKRMVQEDEALAGIVGRVESAAVLNHSKELHSKARASLLGEGFTSEELDAHRPRHIRDYPDLTREADVIIGMTAWHRYLIPKADKAKYVNLSEAAGESYKAVPDPFLARSQAKYDTAMAVIKRYLAEFADRLKKGERI